MSVLRGGRAVNEGVDDGVDKGEGDGPRRLSSVMTSCEGVLSVYKWQR